MRTLLPLAFDSDFVPTAERLAFCREEFGLKVLNLELEPTGGAPFRLRIGGDAFGGVRASWVASSPMRLWRDIRRAGDGDDRFSVLIALKGGYRAGHGADLHAMRPGEFMALDSGRSGGAECHVGGAFLTLLAPREAMRPHFGAAPPEFGRTYRGSGGALKLLESYLRFASVNGAGAPAVAREAMGRHLAEMTAMLFNGADDAAETCETPGVKAARQAAVLDDLDQHFADPGITVAASAARLGISVRYAQALLESVGTTFGAELKRRRLARALVLLRDPAKTLLRIIDIALDCGFSDLSHFNRVFRAEFGDSPSGARAAAGL